MISYSAALRDIRKNHPDRLKEFLKEYKEAFDQAREQELSQPEMVALTQALLKLNA